MMEKFRELRYNKIALEMIELMNKMVAEIKSQEELADIFSAWSVVLGTTIAQLGGAKDGSIDGFLIQFDKHVKSGFLAELKRSKKR